MEIYLVRHTPTVAEKGLCYGQTDLAILEPYQELFEKIKKNIDTDEFDIYTSPLQRCVTLAEYLSNKTITTSASLMEVNFGDWENKLWNDIPQQTMQPWMNDFVNIAPPDGESFIALFSRVKDFIETELLLKDSKKSIVIVTHAGVIRSFLCYILEVPLSNAFKIPVEFSSVTKVYLNRDKAYNSIKYFNK